MCQQNRSFNVRVKLIKIKTYVWDQDFHHDQKLGHCNVKLTFDLSLLGILCFWCVSNVLGITFIRSKVQSMNTCPDTSIAFKRLSLVMYRNSEPLFYLKRVNRAKYLLTNSSLPVAYDEPWSRKITNRMYW